ncbi:hypothetical protein GOP47_0013082 [Adiantum capillus-veneris]|uniref:Uncharacterized protein n=1 Tax=Adiantum capillus-veneris TaxID=13818 RepID=A0A9D4USF9_ADICA|nr:hypothetical protein GOP47_0013082 [Adiantum capillus-veneris]
MALRWYQSSREESYGEGGKMALHVFVSLSLSLAEEELDVAGQKGEVMEGTLHASPLQKRADCWPWERLLARTREARGRPREQLLTWNQIQGGSSDPRQIVETRARWERALIRSVAPFCIVGSRARNRALWAGKSVKVCCKVFVLFLFVHFLSKTGILIWAPPIKSLSPRRQRSKSWQIACDH